MTPADHYPRLEVRSTADLRRWLSRECDRSEGVWLVTFRKHVGNEYVSRESVLDELLCFGWIDGVRRQLDADRTMQLITPRRTHAWTLTYRTRATRLIDEGRMAAQGLRTIRDAQEAGTWVANADVDQLLVPADLDAALAAAPDARAWFTSAAPSYRRNLLRWIAKAKQAETRSKRIALAVDSASRGEKILNL